MSDKRKTIYGISLILISTLLLYAIIVVGIDGKFTGKEHAAIGILGGYLINSIVHLLGPIGSIIMLCSVFVTGLNLLIKSQVFLSSKLILITSILFSISTGIISNVKDIDYSSGMIGKHIGSILLSLFGLLGSILFITLIMLSLIICHYSQFVPKIRSFFLIPENKYQYGEKSTMHLNNNSINDNRQAEYIDGKWTEL